MQKVDEIGQPITVVYRTDGGYRFFPFDSDVIQCFLEVWRDKFEEENPYKNKSGAV